MAKFGLKIQAQQYRRSGKSIKQIASELGVAKSSVSSWVKDIILSPEQLNYLKESEKRGSALGRWKIVNLRRERRLLMLGNHRNNGIKEIGAINNREMFLTGLALYWAEGGKKNHRVEFCNSDPNMIRFFIHWFNKSLGVKKEDLRCRIGINESHIGRESIVKDYWARVTGIDLCQFNKTSFKHVQSRKIYENFDNHYGTLSILVVKSADLYYRIMGLLEGLSLNLAA
jgi:hypothetical protein